LEKNTEPNWTYIYKVQHQEFSSNIDSFGWDIYQPQWQMRHALIERALSRSEDSISIATDGLDHVIIRQELVACNAQIKISWRVCTWIMMLECSGSHFEILMKDRGAPAYRRAYIHQELIWQRSNI